MGGHRPRLLTPASESGARDASPIEVTTCGSGWTLDAADAEDESVQFMWSEGRVRGWSGMLLVYAG